MGVCQAEILPEEFFGEWHDILHAWNQDGWRGLVADEVAWWVSLIQVGLESTVKDLELCLVGEDFEQMFTDLCRAHCLSLSF